MKNKKGAKMSVKCDINVGVELPVSFKATRVLEEMEEKFQESLIEILDDESIKIVNLEIDTLDNALIVVAKVDEENMISLDSLAEEIEESWADIITEKLEDLGEDTEELGIIDYVEVDLRY